MAKWWKYFINPVGAIAQDLTGNSSVASRILNPGDGLIDYLSKGKYGDVGDITNEGISNAYDWLTTGEGGQGISKLWDDLTGKSAQDRQNQYNREMAEEEYQRNLQSISDTASAYQAAGFNPNLMYSKDGVSYSAPQLTAYSGSQKIDNIMGRVGKVLSMIPAMYQATAALEGIDQARERTKQAEIKTMADGMNLIDLGYKLGDNYLSHPFTFNLDSFRTSRHFRGISPGFYGEQVVPINGRTEEFDRYADAALKNKFELLNSIGIKNQMNTTLNNWRGYQYDLDRRYGAAGRIIGMASQGLGAVSKFIPAPKFSHSWK